MLSRNLLMRDRILEQAKSSQIIARRQFIKGKSSIAITAEHNFGFIRRPMRRTVVSRVSGQSQQSRAVSIH